MVNRKIETFLIVIGLVVFVFFVISGVSMLVAHNDEEAGTDMYDSFIEQGLAEFEDDEMPSDDEIPTFAEFNETLRAGGIMVLVVSVAAFIVGLASVFMIAKNKYPKVAGSLLLLIGVFIALLQFQIALIGSFVYILAGIMALFRKPRVRAI